jgi:hypothetical protein
LNFASLPSNLRSIQPRLELEMLVELYEAALVEVSCPFDQNDDAGFFRRDRFDFDKIIADLSIRPRCVAR